MNLILPFNGRRIFQGALSKSEEFMANSLIILLFSAAPTLSGPEENQL
jgi:hypothetical protein